MKQYEKLHEDETVCELIVRLYIKKVTPEEAAEMLREYDKRCKEVD